MLKTRIEHSTNAATLHLSGRMVRGDELDRAGRIAKSQLATQIVVDLSHVSSVDARGLGALVELQRWATNSGRTLRIVNPSRRVRELIAITNLHSVLDIEMSAPKRGAATIRGTRPNIGCLPLAICAADI